MCNVLEQYGVELSSLCSGLFSDVMDRMGYKHQIILNMKRNQQMVNFIGRARTVYIETAETNDENIRMGLSFLGDLKEGEILFVKGSHEFAYFGELMTKLSTRQGVSGVIIDGLTRDTNYTFREDVKLPILAKGYSPVDIKGRGFVKAVDVDINVDGICVKSSDLIYADNEAVCVIPKDIEEEVMNRVMEKILEEQRITQFINSNMSVEELLNNVTEF